MRPPMHRLIHLKRHANMTANIFILAEHGPVIHDDDSDR